MPQLPTASGMCSRHVMHGTETGKPSDRFVVRARVAIRELSLTISWACSRVSRLQKCSSCRSNTATTKSVQHKTLSGKRSHGDIWTGFPSSSYVAVCSVNVHGICPERTTDQTRSCVQPECKPAAHCTSATTAAILRLNVRTY